MFFVPRPYVFLLVATMAATLTGCSNVGSGGAIATVNGQDISRQQFYDRLESSPQAKGILTQMIQTALIEQYAKDNNIQVTDADIKEKVDELRARYPNGQFDAILKAQNISDQELANILRDQIIVDKALGSQVKVSDADVQAYLQKNHATLDTAAQVHAKHILVRDLPTAEQVEAKLKGGESFDAAAKEYSQDPGSKDKGGDIGFFTQNQMVAPFAAAAFSQPVGVVGPPVKSPFGYHIILVVEKKPAQVATMATSGNKIRTQLQQQQEGAKVPVFLNGLRNKAKITVNDPKLADVAATPVPTPAGAPTPAAAPSTGK